MIATETSPNGYVPPPEGQADRVRDDLQAMLDSPGWQRFVAHVATQWSGPEVLIRLVAALNAEQYTLAARITAAGEAVNAVLSWPKQRIEGGPDIVPPRRVARPHRRARA
jgi:hypothetical protein